MLSLTSLTVAPVNRSCEEARQLGKWAGVRTLAPAVMGSAEVDDGEPVSMRGAWQSRVDSLITTGACLESTMGAG